MTPPVTIYRNDSTLSLTYPDGLANFAEDKYGLLSSYTWTANAQAWAFSAGKCIGKLISV